MSARFLRDEAARFRDMAETADREATRVRLLAMAADYEARAGVDVESPEPSEPNVGEALSEVAEPPPDEAIKVRPGRKTTLGLKETVLVPRRPVAGSRTGRGI